MIFQLVTTHQVNFASLSCTSSKRILVPKIPADDADHPQLKAERRPRNQIPADDADHPQLKAERRLRSRL